MSEYLVLRDVLILSSMLILEKRAAIPSVYLLLGALPIEAELHKRQLSLLYIYTVISRKFQAQT
jgi:hypothetical protein